MHKKLLIPGPTDVSKKILCEQNRPLISHRGKAFSELYSRITEKLAEFFELTEDCRPTVTTSSGTLWFDIIGRSIVKKKALVCINGAFSERFGKTIRACGKKADFIGVDWGKAVKPDMIAEHLDTGEYDTLAVCHNESSTGVRNPIHEIGNLIHKNYPDTIFVIDSVSAMAGDKTIPAEIGCDIIFASTQKCFALPPGLAISLVTDRAIERAKDVSNRGSYTDLVEIFEFDKKHQTPFTPNISLLYALNRRMDLLLEETYDHVYQRHKKMAEVTQQWARKHFTLFSEPGYESITVTCVQNVLGKNVEKLNKKLAGKGYIISNGYGKLKEKTFRIGHMGEWTPTKIRKVIKIINQIWGLEN